MINAKVIVLTIGFLLSLLAIDIIFAYRADQLIRENDYYFSKAMKKTKLDFNGDWRQGCKIDTVLYFYKFKTCFVMRDTNTDGELFYFKYAKPVPILMGGMNGERYAFRNISITESVKIIYPSGRIEEIKQ